MSEPAPSPLRWRPLALFLLAAGATLSFLAVLTRNPVPLFLALPLLLAPVAAGLSGPKRSPPVRIEASVEGAGGEVRLEGVILPERGIDARDLVVELDRPAGLLGAPMPQLDRSATQLRFRAAWFAPEPILTEVRPPSVLWRDPMGLVERETRSSAEPLVVRRYPPELLRIGTLRLERTTPLPGETHSHRIGDSGEFHGLRPARPEDPLRQINWRASARAGRPLANEYDLDKTGDVLLLLDARPTPLGPAADARLFSIARAAAVGLSDSLLTVKARVGLGVFGEFLDVVPLATGRTQRIRVERMLERARLARDPAPPERCAVAARRAFPHGLTTIVLSSLADDPSQDLSPFLRRRGFPTVVLSPSPLPLMAETSPLTAKDEEVAARIARLVRRERIARAWQESPTIDWDNYWSLDQFVDFVRRPRVRRVG